MLFSHYRSDLVQQFFLTKTETLHKVHWDDKLKNNDHYDFLFNAKKNNLHLVTCTDIKVMHNKKVRYSAVVVVKLDCYLSSETMKGCVGSGKRQAKTFSECVKAADVAL